jgi:hypothetical protein
MILLLKLKQRNIKGEAGVNNRNPANIAPLQTFQGHLQVTCKFLECMSFYFNGLHKMTENRERNVNESLP